MSATWITIALCHRRMENNDGHDSNPKKWDPHSLQMGKCTKTQTLKTCFGTSTLTQMHKHNRTMKSLLKSISQLIAPPHTLIQPGIHTPTVHLSITKGITQVQKIRINNAIFQGWDLHEDGLKRLQVPIVFRHHFFILLAATNKYSSTKRENSYLKEQRLCIVYCSCMFYKNNSAGRGTVSGLLWKDRITSYWPTRWPIFFNPHAMPNPKYNYNDFHSCQSGWFTRIWVRWVHH